MARRLFSTLSFATMVVLMGTAFGIAAIRHGHLPGARYFLLFVCVIASVSACSFSLAALVAENPRLARRGMRALGAAILLFLGAMLLLPVFG